MLVDVTECQFKLSLHKKEFERVIRIIKQSKLTGHAIIAYLQKKGFPQVAVRVESKNDHQRESEKARALAIKIYSRKTNLETR